MIEAAKGYARLGLSVLPWHYVDGAKRPAIRWKGLQQRRLSEQELTNQWSSNPMYNVGVVTGAISNLVVVDADDDDAVNWVADNLPQTEWSVETGRGMQFGYRHPGDPVRNRTKINSMELDLRGDGGYVAMPPSIHKTGTKYQWAFRAPTSTETLPLYDPKWFPAKASPQFNVDLGGQIDKSRAFNRASKWIAKRDPAVSGNNGDTHTFVTACQLVRDFGLPETEALTLMLDWNVANQPPWSTEDLAKKIRSAQRSGSAAIGSKANTIAPRVVTDLSGWTNQFNAKESIEFPENDYGNAQRFAQHYKHIARYAYDNSTWFIWNDQQWKADNSGAAVRLAKTVPSHILREAEQVGGDKASNRIKHAFRTGAANKLMAMLALATSEPGMPSLTGDFDQDPMKVNTPSGIIDLTNGNLLAHNPELMQSMITAVPYSSTAACPRWLTFIDQICQGSAELSRYLQQLAGYSLTGMISEHIFIYCYGGGRNGKSTFLNTIIKIFGDYAGSAPPNLLVSKRNDPHPTELAFLRKLRMALGGEVKPGERLDEGKLKHLTGGEKITAREMRADFSQFTPTHTLWLAGNTKLKIYATDLGMWERIKLIPFKAIFKDGTRDAKLPEKLLAEGPGILNWCVQGCVDWYEHGFIQPDAVTTATNEYKADENLFQQWLDERTEAGPHRVPHKELRQNYIMWCDDNAIKNPASTRAFTNAMREAGYERSSGGARNWSGLRIAPF
jgi:putative DNA primase/helicase